MEHQPPPSPHRRVTSAEALAGIWSILLISFVITILYFTRDILVPVALAALLTFLLAPLVSRVERWVGRVAAVGIVSALVFALFALGCWAFTRQLVDLAAKLPDYKANMEQKLTAFRVPKDGIITRLTRTFDELKRELPKLDSDKKSPNLKVEGSEEKEPIPVEVVSSPVAAPMDLAQTIVASLLSPLGTAALVALLVVCMLLQRENLKGRVIRLIGHARIGATTRAMDDAAQRISKYLLMQLIVNVSYGVPLAIGLYLIGVPNALLWGIFSAILRFIPYIGPWIGAVCPIVLSLAISNSWTTPLLTLGLFIVLELISNNLVEPWLYGASTGVSAIALIVATVFWTWMWGPVGLLLATPLTVCLVVLGLHVPRFRFLSIALSDEVALAPAEECYFRILGGGSADAIELTAAYAKTKSLAELYDDVLVPVIVAGEADLKSGVLDETACNNLMLSVGEIVEDAQALPLGASELPENESTLLSVLCLPANARRDALAGEMLAHLLKQQGVAVEAVSAILASGELVNVLGNSSAETVCVSVVEPSTILHGRYLVSKLRRKYPKLTILVGLWGATENMEASTQRLKEVGADTVVFSLAEAVVQITKSEITHA